MAHCVYNKCMHWIRKIRIFACTSTSDLKIWGTVAGYGPVPLPYCCLHVDSLPGLLFIPDDDGDMVLRTLADFHWTARRYIAEDWTIFKLSVAVSLCFRGLNSLSDLDCINCLLSHVKLGLHCRHSLVRDNALSCLHSTGNQAEIQSSVMTLIY
jgi:hypothetical protein